MFTGVITDDLTSEFDPFALSSARNSPAQPAGLH